MPNLEDPSMSLVTASPGAGEATKKMTDMVEGFGLREANVDSRKRSYNKYLSRILNPSLG